MMMPRYLAVICFSAALFMIMVTGCTKEGAVKQDGPPRKQAGIQEEKKVPAGGQTAPAGGAPLPVVSKLPDTAPEQEYGQESVSPDKVVNSVPILMYHEVGTPKGRWPQLYVLPEDLAGQLEWLKANGYTTIRMEDLYNNWQNQKPLPAKPIILTFDDGYRTMHTTVLPMLKARGMKATFFLFPNNINTQNGLTHPMIRELAAAGMEIGAHGYTHADMDTLTEEQLKKELGEAKTVIEGIIKKPVEYLCYPTGKYNRTVTEMTRKYGYKLAVTMKSGMATVKQDPLELKRIGVYYKDGVHGLAGKLK